MGIRWRSERAATRVRRTVIPRRSFDSRGSGAVYIFAAEGEVWRRAFLKARTAPSCDRLGEQVVLSGDGKVLSAWATGLAADAIGRDPKADGLRRNHRAGVTSGCRFTGSGGSSARCRRSNRSASAGPASTRVARHRARLAPADAMDGARDVIGRQPGSPGQRTHHRSRPCRRWMRIESCAIQQ
jgi:hypothetical protein